MPLVLRNVSVLVRLLTEAAMFHKSSQGKYWIFGGEDDLEQKRYQANQKSRKKILESGKVRWDVTYK